MVGGLLHLWEQWDIHILVILSFALQIILFLFAGTRRREGSIRGRIFLWLAYQMADYTAIYALGRMSISTRSPTPNNYPQEKEMVAFWAPFLLLHLGGPDTLTSYAFEDNQLWLRHLLTLVGQVIGAAYVLYQFIATSARSSRVMLAAAGVLMFISGLLKYGERTWALKSASLSNIASSLDKPEPDGGRRRRSPYDGRHATHQKLDSEEVLLGAHHVFGVCKSLFTGGLRMAAYEYEAIGHGIQLDGDMYMLELVEMELSLMYDILYTKAGVIHTWYGCCIRVISTLSAVAAFLLFQFMISSKAGAYNYNRADTAITYVLFVGALAMEVLASIRVAGSSWACASMHARRWDRLCSAVMRLRRPVKAGNRRRACMDSLGQYNMLEHCASGDATKVWVKIAKAVGLEDQWNRLRYSRTISISQDTKAFVLEEIRKRNKQELSSAWGRWTLEKKGMYEYLKGSVDSIELDDAILVWHFATNLYISSCSNEVIDEADKRVSNTAMVLSNHMMFLLVEHPYLLPGVVHRSQYKQSCLALSKIWHARSTDQEDSIMSLSTSMKAKKLAEWVVQVESEYLSSDKVDGGRAYHRGVTLAKDLLCNIWDITMSDMLQVITAVWFEMLCFASHHCGEESHAKKLSSGCEFLTALWLLTGHTSMYDLLAQSYHILAEYSPDDGHTNQAMLAGVREHSRGSPVSSDESGPVWVVPA